MPELAVPATNLQVAWSRLFVRALADAGITDAVLSPGSRSAPLAIALAAEPALRLHVVVDERSAAFFALGQARVTRRPTLLVCTSGTAGAHYLPALIEASQSFVPMLVVTADRPWELYDAAAPQTIDQVKLFGDFVRHYAELGAPEPSPTALRAVRRIAAQAVASTYAPTPGPAHVNARFRKPLEPVPVSAPEPWEPLIEALFASGGPVVHPASTAIDAGAIEAVLCRIATATRGVIVCGPAPLAQGDRRAAILELARRTGFPLVAESTSQLRFGGDRSGVREGGPVDAIFRAKLDPADLVLQLGAPPISAAYPAFCARVDGARVVIAEHGWNDPDANAAMLVQAEPGAFADALVARLSSRPAPSAWASSAVAAGARAMELARSATRTFSEASIAASLVDSCPDGALLVVSNSTPVRDVDLFCAPSARAIRVLHQRGASGIDGLVSGAAGAAIADGGPAALLIGDIALLHDLTGLGLLARVREPIVVVVVQNGGGRIFDQLPVASRVDPSVFERCFATPEPVHFDRAAQAFDVPCVRAVAHVELASALSAAWDRRGATLIEAVAPPRERAHMLRGLWAELDRETSEPRGKP